MNTFEKIALGEVKIATYPFRRQSLKALAEKYKLNYQAYDDNSENKLDKIFGTINGKSIEIQDFCTFVSSLNIIFNSKFAVGNTSLTLDGKSKEVRGYFRLFPKMEEIEKWIISIINDQAEYDVKNSETLYYGVKNSEISDKKLIVIAVASVVVMFIAMYLIQQ
jgi:hypothetical protein